MKTSSIIRLFSFYTLHPHQNVFDSLTSIKSLHLNFTGETALHNRGMGANLADATVESAV